MQAHDWITITNLQGNFGDKDKLNTDLVLTLDELARNTGHHLLVTSGTGETHINDSYHYKGLAIDFMVPKLELKDIPDYLLTILRYKFNGVGVYSSWRLASGLKPIGGFHVDWRPGASKALWLKGHSGEGYESITLANLNKYFL